MGNEFEADEIKDNDPKDITDKYFKYSIISKKGGERRIDDTYINFSDLESSEECKKRIHFGLFGVFDGHNNDYVANYLRDNCHKIFMEKAGDISKDKPNQKLEEIFKIIDKNLRNESKNKNENDNINKNINFDADEREIQFYKKLIEETKEIPDEFKKVEDSQLKDLILFKNLFKYNNNYLYCNDDTDYIGSSASIALITNDNIITADLGITACILFNKKGEIMNIKKEKEELLKPEHVFSNKKEKKRIKRFNENVDYENLKINIYVPASRCFGLFKYKADELLKEENQIISCIPEVNIYNRDSVDFILLMTKGMINLFKDDINDFVKKIVEKDWTDESEVKISKILNELIEKRMKEVEEKEEKEKKEEEKNKEKMNNIPSVANNPIYVGKEDFSEENEIIKEMKKNYFKDIMDLNKNNCYSCHDKYNITCILIKIKDARYPPPIIVEKEKEMKKEEKPKAKPKDKEEKKIEKPEDKKEEKDKNEIIDLNIDKEKEKLEKKKEEKEENHINEIKEDIKEEIKEEKKDEIENGIKETNINNEEKKDENKIEEKKNEGDENIKKDDNNKIEDDKINVNKENKNNEENNIQEEQNKIENNIINIDEENKIKEENKDRENEQNKEEN